MNLKLSVPIFVLTCVAAPWLVAEAAQQQGPDVFPGYAEQTATKPADADGERSPALTGSEISLPMWERRPLYRLCVSDVIEITFSLAPEFNQTITIQPDGFIPLKAIEQFYAAGLTLPELQNNVRTAYAAVMRDPEVTIVLKAFEKPSFVATGQIARPGKYELHGDVTVIEALAQAGGFTSNAKHSKVVLFRRRSDQLTEARLLDVKRMMNLRNLQEDIHLQPGDLLFVPQNSISKIQRFLPTSNMGMYLNPSQY